MITLKVGGSGSSGNCYSITDGEKVFLLDAGIPLPDIKRLTNWKVWNIDGCFITHAHNDHSKSYRHLKHMGIPIFAPYVDENTSFKSKGGYRLKAFELPHDETLCYGSYIVSPSGHRMLYMTDFSYCAYTFKKLKIQTMLIECNHMDDIAEEGNEGKIYHVLRGHSSLSTVCEFLRVNHTEELKTVILCHLSSENADESEMLKQVQEVVGEKVKVGIAKKGVKLEL